MIQRRSWAELATHAKFVTGPLLLTIAVHHSALGTFFAQDDITFLSRAAGLEGSSDLFRPVSADLAFRAQYHAFGLDPLGYHAVNLVLHLANVMGVYALTVKLTDRRSTGAAAAVLFGCSSIPFTLLHWASGIADLLACLFLLVATLLHLESHHRGPLLRWAAAVVAFLAMLSKEHAVLWVLVAVFLDWLRFRQRPALTGTLPAMTAAVGFGSIFLLSGQMHRFVDSEAYALTGSPLLLLLSLGTYLVWSVALWNPIRDAIAALDPRSWIVAGPVIIALALLWRQHRGPPQTLAFGAVWWLAFLLPVLPLTQHAYLYYLYVPWAGGAIVVAAMLQGLLARRPRRFDCALAVVALVAFAAMEWRNVHVRETATRDHLPIDRTMRDAMLLRHALPALRSASLAPGSWVLFVSPVLRPRFDLMTGSATRPENISQRRSYLPLEAAMRGGETLRLFHPRVQYAGFSSTIPPGLEHAMVFHYDQRGWLEFWGSGRQALLRQARVQMKAQQWLSADTTFQRARALGDSAPAVQWRGMR